MLTSYDPIPGGTLDYKWKDNLFDFIFYDERFLIEAVLQVNLFHHMLPQCFEK